MSTQVVPVAVMSGGGWEIPESSSKLRHGHLRHDGIHTLKHHLELKQVTLPDQFTHREGLQTWTKCSHFTSWGVHHWSADKVSSCAVVWAVASVHAGFSHSPCPLSVNKKDGRGERALTKWKTNDRSTVVASPCLKEVQCSSSFWGGPTSLSAD